MTITYAALLGMLALAGALAFGLGGRDVANRVLQDAYDSGQRNKDQVKHDMQQGRDRAQQQAQDKAPAGTGAPTATGAPTTRFDREPNGVSELDRAGGTPPPPRTA